MYILIIAYIILVLLMSLFYAVLVLFYLLGWQSISPFKPSGRVSKTKVTIIVPARNEQKNIVNLLECLKHQNYPKGLFEVIVVDDHSDDLTPELVENFGMKNLFLIHLKDYVAENEIAFKKRAVETAIAQSNSELIVATDADCVMGKNWLYQLTQFYEETNSQFIVAPVSYAPIHTFLDKAQILDFLTIMGITGASVYHKMHNMSNGANMAYTREAFLSVSGYENADDSASGDDVFLIEKIGRQFPHEVNYLKNREAIVFTKPCSTFHELFQQRMRWISKTKHYTGLKTKIIALLVLFFYILLLVNIVLSIINVQYLSILLMQLIIKFMVDFALLQEVSIFFRKEKLLKYFPIVEFLHIPFTFVVGISAQFFRYTWKSRKIKE